MGIITSPTDSHFTSTGATSSLSTSVAGSSPSGDAAAKKSGVSGGTIAGAVIGSIVGLAIVIALIWLCRRRRKRNNTNVHEGAASGLDYDEKQVADATPAAFPMKPELHGQTTINDGGLPQVVDYNASQTQYSHYPGTAELQSSPRQRPPELYAPYHQSAELPGAGYHHTAELHSPTPRLEMEANVPPYAPAAAPSHHYEPPTQPYQYEQPQQHAQELYPRSPAPSRSIVQRQLSSDEISALEEEERRIDAEMEEVRRMKELRDAKLAVQQKLREAKGE